MSPWNRLSTISQLDLQPNIKTAKKEKRKSRNVLSTLSTSFKRAETFSIFFFFSMLLPPFLPFDKKARCTTRLLEGEGNCIVHCPSEQTIIRLRLSVSSLRFSSRRTRQFGRGGCRKKMNTVIFCHRVFLPSFFPLSTLLPLFRANQPK